MYLRRISFLLMAFVALNAVAQTTKTPLTVSNLKAMYATKTYNETSIHDPSVVYNNNPTMPRYYIFGSHLGAAYSTDLLNWTKFGGEESANCTLFANTAGQRVGFADAYNTHAVTTVKNSKGVEVAFGNFNAHDWQNSGFSVAGNQWAPDVVYNPTMKKWLMYMSLNGNSWGSVIVCMAANNIEGPYVYQGPVVFSGFQGTYDHNGFTKTNDFKHTDYTIATGLTSLATRYQTGVDWGKYWPNCIDPCVFYAEDGELWMAYGSWSGGIFMLKLDKSTGLRDYTYTYPYQVNGTTTTPGSANMACTSDPYFGKKIAGGAYVSGEGSYIQYINGYYYLFMSYGFFSPEGGYEMRVFRSTSPTGPYKDASGNTATFTSYQLNYGPNAVTNKGMKLLGAFNKWGTMTVGECAEGHNSAIVDEAGNAFVVYHTKFNNGTAGHCVRVRQLFQNERGWLVASPFRHTAGTAPLTTQAMIAGSQLFSAKEIAGTYHFLLHPYKLNHNAMEEATPVTVTLTEDGKVTGERTGTWQVSQEGKSYVKLTIGGVIYYGVMMETNIDGLADMPARCLTAVSNSGVPIWLYKYAPKAELANAYQTLYNFFNTEAKTTLSSHTPSGFDGVTIDYKAVNYTTKVEEPQVLTKAGRFTPTADGHKITVSATLYATDSVYYLKTVQSYSRLTAQHGDIYNGTKAYYKLDATDCINQLNASESIAVDHAGSGQTPTIYNDAVRGKVLQQYFGAQADASYTKMNNPLYGSDADGFTVGMWVKRQDNNAWDAIFSFFGGNSPADAGGRIYITGNSYIGYNDAIAPTWFDINHPNSGTYNDIPVGSWAYITLTADATGCKFYVNGDLQTTHTWDSSGSTQASFDYATMLKNIKSYAYMYLGMGSFWGSTPALLSKLVVYDRALNDKDISYLYYTMRTDEFDPYAMLGDVDRDGVISMADANMVVNYYLGVSVPEMNVNAADMDGDGVITMADANAIVNLYLGVSQ